tara:strand:+ start:129 stop:299 length:171 start_codon:yes stop_codon:yes gene_type:complete
MKVSRFGSNLIQIEGGPENWIVTGKSAVAAVVHALVGKIKRGEKAHGSAELTLGES